MDLRMNYRETNPEAFKALLGLEQYVPGSGLDRMLIEWVKLRASLINGCSFCIDMHAKDLMKLGVPVDKIMLVAVWREVPHFTEEERAALELTEYATKLSDNGVPREVYDRVREHFSEKEFVDLIMAISAINAWNRIGVATGLYPGCFD